MARFTSITMSMRDIDRLKVIQAIIEGHLKASTAANRLQLTKRHAGAPGDARRRRKAGAGREGVDAFEVNKPALTGVVLP